MSTGGQDPRNLTQKQRDDNREAAQRNEAKIAALRANASDESTPTKLETKNAKVPKSPKKLTVKGALSRSRMYQSSCRAKRKLLFVPMPPRKEESATQ